MTPAFGFSPIILISGSLACECMVFFQASWCCTSLFLQFVRASVCSIKNSSHFFTRQSRLCCCLLFKMCYIHIVVICLQCLWYIFFQLSIIGQSRHHLILGTSLLHLQTTFNLWGSCYPYLEACHCLTFLRHVARDSSCLCREGLSEGKYWLENSRTPCSKFWRALCKVLCRLYYGHWYWFVYSCIC